MTRVLSIILAGIIIAGFASPFVRDSWKWFEISHNYPLSQQDREALQSWQGTPESYMRMLRGQCRSNHPTDSSACANYEL